MKALEKSFLRTGASLKEGGNKLLSGNSAAVCGDQAQIIYYLKWDKFFSQLIDH